MIITATEVKEREAVMLNQFTAIYEEMIEYMVQRTYAIVKDKDVKATR